MTSSVAEHELVWINKTDLEVRLRQRGCYHDQIAEARNSIVGHETGNAMAERWSVRQGNLECPVKMF